MQIIPAIDIINGRCVRLTRGDYNSMTEYDEDPLRVAKTFEDHGLTRLHLVDLDGARQKKVINHKVLETIASSTNLEIDFGGGIQSHQDLRLAFEAGAAQVTAGSVAVKKPDLLVEWLREYGGERIILGADVKNDKIAVGGWQETSELDIGEFLEEKRKLGIEYVVSTDIEQDGMLEGPSFSLYERLGNQFPDLKLIASGGVSSIEDLQKLKDMGLFGAIVGKAIYEQRISLKELSTI